MMKKRNTIKSIVMLLFIMTAPVIAAWQPEQRLTDDPWYSYTTLPTLRATWCVAACGDTVHVVWIDNRDIPHDDEIYYKRSTDAGEHWGPDICLTSYNSDPPETDASSPAIAVSGSAVHVTWTKRVDDLEIFYIHSLDGGETWGPVKKLTHHNIPSANLWDSYYSTVAAQGPNVYVVFERKNIEDTREGGKDPHNWRLVGYKRSFTNGVTWDPQLYEITDLCMFDATNPKVAVVPLDTSSDRNPSISMKYEGPDPPTCRNHEDQEPQNPHKVYFVFEAEWEIFCCIEVVGYDGPPYYICPMRLTYTSSGTSKHPSIAASGSDVHLVWEWNGYGNKILYKRSTNGGGIWSADDSVGGGIDRKAYRPSIAVSGQNIHVVWEDNRDGYPFRPEIYYTRSTDGGITWEPETRLTQADSSSEAASVAVGNSAVHVAWTDRRHNGFNREIYYKRNPTGNPIDQCCATDESLNGNREENALIQLKITPNPFISHTRILGHEKEKFNLYDSSGRLVGIYKGSQIGYDVAPGVYFVKSLSKNSQPVRVVKVK